MCVLEKQGKGNRRGWWPSTLPERLGFAAACLVVLLQGCSQTATTESSVGVVDAAGGTAQLLGAPGGAPVWGPSGEAIVWATEEGLYRREATEGEPTLLSTRVAAGRPAWSPEGGAIAMVDREAEALTVLDAETGAIRFSVGIVTRDAGQRSLALPVLGGPAWSPDGSRLAFICWDGHGDEICVVGADGTGLRQVTHIETRKGSQEPAPGALVFAASNAGPPAWSPSGTEVALSVYPEQRGAPAGVFVVDLEAGTARRVSSLLPNSEIAWFADGGSLLFSAWDQGRSDALRAPIDGGEAERLTAGLPSGAREPALSTDQSRVVVVSGGDIIVLDLDGNAVHSVSGDDDRRLPAWSPAGDRIAFAVGPDPLASYP